MDGLHPLERKGVSVDEQKHRERKKKALKRQHSGNEEESEERRLRRQLRRAQKLAKQLELLGLDENGNELDNFSLAKYPVREFKFSIPGTMSNDVVSLNPVVTIIAVVWLWGLVLWVTYAGNALETLAEWRGNISLTLTWLIHGTKIIYLVFLCCLACKYGHIKLGTKDDRPEFSNLSYISMIFTAGATNSLLAYAVYEPLSHQTDNFYSQAGYRSQDEIDMFAVNAAVTDWGLGCWAPYTLVAVAMSLAAYCFKLPMLYRSCFYPILGQYTWGWMGDVIDGFIIVAIMANVVTSLGFAALNLVAGLMHMEWIEEESTEEQIQAIQNAIVWILSIVSLVSAVSGLHGGIKAFCVVAMGLSALLLLLVFFLDDSKYLLNLQVQEVGMYLQTSLFQLNFWTDAFGQLREGSGRAVDGKSSETWWYSDWFNFAQLWWVVAGAVNGQFISCISKGRRLWEVIFYSLVVPVAFCLIWFCIWGGIALRQSRQALEMETLGETLYNNSAHFVADGSAICYDVPQNDILVEGQVVFTSHLPGVTPVCKYDSETPDSAIFNVLKSFSFGPGLSMLFMFTCIVFYMTVAGSASLIVDKMASSGRKNNHLARRMFWLITVGALTTVLLSAGGEDALTAIQAAIMICGIPCAILLCFMLQAITLMCQQATDLAEVEYQFPTEPEFSIPVYGGLFNVFEYAASLGKVHQARLDRGMGTVTSAQVTEFIKGLFVPFVSLRQVLGTAYPENDKTNVALVAAYAVVYVAWAAFGLASLWWEDCEGLAGALCVIHGGILALVRSGFRARYNIRSNAMADLVTSTLFWPQVLSQMRLHSSVEVAVVSAQPSMTNPRLDGDENAGADESSKAPRRRRTKAKEVDSVSDPESLSDSQ